MALSQKILLVEDNPGDADLIYEMLCNSIKITFDVQIVDRLSSAISFLRKTKVHAVLLDLDLPDSNGIDTVKAISSSFPHIAIVVITGINDAELGVQAVAAGAQDYLVKGLIPEFYITRVLQYAIQRKQADEQIRQSEEFLRASLDGLSAHIAIIDYQGNIITVNKAWNRFARDNGIPEETIWQDINYLDICNIASGSGDMVAQEFAQGIQDVLAKKLSIFVLDYPCHSPDEKRWFHGKVTSFPDKTRPNLIIAHENITERTLSIQNLQRSKEKFRSIVDNIAIGIALINKNSEILEMNKQMRQWYPDVSVSKKPKCIDVFACCYGDTAKKKQCPVHQTLTDGKIHKKIQTHNNITYRMLSSPLFDENGKINSAVIIKEDITQRLSIEKKLRQAQKMESLGTLAGGIAHDFNNILTAILGYATLIKLGQPKESEIYDDVLEIERAALRACDLVNQILTFSRMKETKFIPTRLDLIIKEALKLIRSTIPTTIEIITEVERVRERVLADPTQLHQIIMNLCTNASHAMEKQGGFLKVGLSTKHVTPSGAVEHSKKRSTKYLELKVKDTGCGIPKDVIDNIFDPYFTTKNLGEGTGLGLSMVQGIMETIGGHIKVDSKPDKGTEFTLLFPVVEDFQNQETEDKVPSIAGGNESILLIDDEASVLKVGQRILNDLGYKVTTESDGEKAIKILKEGSEEFDLIITDMAMPKMNGIKLAREAFKIRPDIPVIICTGYSNAITKDVCRDIGIKALVHKPLSITTIASEIRKIFNHGKNVEK